jgi:hypothetical protein
LVESIDNLMREYSNGSQQSTQTQLPVVSEPTVPSVEIAKLNLTEAVLFVMAKRPGYAWRGAEITRGLKGLGYNLNKMGQRVSARLIERARSEGGHWERLEKSATSKFPRYRLKEIADE